MMEDNNNKEATYNQAQFLMMRLDNLLRVVDDCDTNLLAFDFEQKLHKYEICFNSLNSILSLISAKLKLEEVEACIKLKVLISEFLESCPVWTKFEIVALSGNKNKKKLNKNNWKSVKELLFKYRLKLESLMESHKIGNPSQKDISKAVMDL